MRQYETCFALNAQADDAAIDRQVNAVTDIIKKHGGQIVVEDRIGTKRFAYPVRGQAQGYYASVIFSAETPVLKDLDRHYRLEDSVLRHLTISYEGDPEKVKEQQKSYHSALDDRERRRKERERRQRDERHGRGGYDRDRRSHDRDRGDERPPRTESTPAPAADENPAPAADVAEKPAETTETSQE